MASGADGRDQHFCWMRRDGHKSVPGRLYVVDLVFEAGTE
jgi:hypothetical protein